MPPERTDVPAPAPSVHPDLRRYQDELATQTGLHAVGSRTHSVVGYGGNINFIEGRDAVVVVNAGTTEALSREALHTYRRSVSKKPVVAIIYTHGYNDHTGGSAVIVAEGGADDVAVYASAAWHGFAEQEVSPLMPEVAIRAASQVGWLLPSGPEGTVGNGLTRPIQGAGGAGYVAPTVDIGMRTAIDIAGVKLELIPAPHDLDDGLIVWMPDERILFGGDLLLLNDIYPTLATPRAEPRRHPQAWIDSMGTAAALHPAHIVNAYGAPVSGEQEVRSRLLGQQRISQYIVDEVHRRVLAGEHADDTAANVTLPRSVTDGRAYRETYHRLAWIVRSLISREFGHFGGDVAELCRYPPMEESQRLLAEMGGQAAVLTRARDTYLAGDARWSLRLATIAMTANPNDESARRIRLNSMRAIAYATDSANERNYLLTAVAMETGVINRVALLRQIAQSSPSDLALRKPPNQVLGVLGRKVRVPESHSRRPFSVRFDVTDRGVTLDITVLPSVMLRGPNPDGGGPDLVMTVSLADLIRGVEGVVGFDAMRTDGRVQVTDTAGVFDDFIAAFAW